MNDGPVTFLIDHESHYALWKLIFRRSLVKFCLWLVPIAVLTTLIFAQSHVFLDILIPIMAGLAAGYVVIGIKWLRLFSRSEKVYRESALLHEEITFSADQVGLAFEQESGNVRMKWVQVAKWDESSEILAIFPNRMIAYILPKDRIPQPLIDFCRHQLIASGLSKSGVLRK